MCVFSGALSLFSLLNSCEKETDSSPKNHVIQPSSTPVNVPSAVPSVSQSGWPRVFVVPDPGAELSSIDTLDASVADPDDDDVSDAGTDAITDAKNDGRPDSDLAPLMGAVTVPGEAIAKGIRKITADVATIRKSPNNGPPVAVIKRGAEVQLVAEFNHWYRVKFMDPAINQRRQGWLHMTMFMGPKTKSCPLNWMLNHTDLAGNGYCERDCKRNTDCKALRQYKCSQGKCFYAGD